MFSSPHSSMSALPFVGDERLGALRRDERLRNQRSQVSTPTSLRILIGIAQSEIANTVQRTLESAGFLTRVAPTVAALLADCRDWRAHLVVVDGESTWASLISLDRDGARRANVAPILAVVRQSDVQAKLTAFALGADDVLVVPFFEEELVARVCAALRRVDSVGRKPALALRFGDLEIDLLNHSVRVDDRQLRLSALEQSLLHVLAVNAGRVVSRDEILDYVWGADFTPGSNVVDRHVRNLRAKLQDHWRHPRYILTVPGRGYCFVILPDIGVPLSGSAQPS